MNSSSDNKPVVGDVVTADGPTQRSNYNIGMSAQPSQHVLGTTHGDDSVLPTSQIYGGTGAEFKFYRREALTPIVISNTSVAGTKIIEIALRALLFEDVAANWQQYCIESFRIQGASTAPFGTASGAIMAGSIPDPYNVLGTDAAENLNTISALTNSKIINAKTDFVFDMDFMDNGRGGYKWTKTGADLRLSSFGNFYIIVNQPSVQGAYAQWSLVASYTVAFRGHTQLTNFLPSYSVFGDLFTNTIGLFEADVTQGSVIGILLSDKQVPDGVTLLGDEILSMVIKFRSESGLESTQPFAQRFFTVYSRGDNKFACFPTSVNPQWASLSSVTFLSRPTSFIGTGTTDAQLTNYVPPKFLNGTGSKTIQQVNECYLEAD
jgi:hypothetical protein